MKRYFSLSVFVFIFVFALQTSLNAQQKLSIDLAAIRNVDKPINGANFSLFYHFSENISGGIEVNRFFSTKSIVEEGTVTSSAWDFDYNFHYYLPIIKGLKVYPIVGFSHTTELEKMESLNLKEESKLNFWSYNIGVGLAYECKRWIPHFEYLHTASFKQYFGEHIQQDFILAGISYEFSLGHHNSKTHHKS